MSFMATGNHWGSPREVRIRIRIEQNKTTLQLFKKSKLRKCLEGF
jgi:hypothetical protein